MDSFEWTAATLKPSRTNSNQSAKHFSNTSDSTTEGSPESSRWCKSKTIQNRLEPKCKALLEHERQRVSNQPTFSMINLLSDTVTQPSQAMREAMMNAVVGDDVFGEDPTVNELQQFGAKLLGHEAALFCPSGTMTNQIAIKLHTHALDEVICDKTSHVYNYETGGAAFNSRVTMNLLDGRNGKITADQVEAAVKDHYDWLPTSRLVVIENTCNKGGGSIYSFEEMRSIREVCDRHDLRLHLDGARLFNALVETGDDPAAVGPVFDSVSICLSKGLGAPVGSLLLGGVEFIRRARRFRKVMGGGMRQAGIIAAGGLFALRNNINRLKIDNDRAKRLGAHLQQLPYVTGVRPVRSNILIFDLHPEIGAKEFVRQLSQNGIQASAFGPQTVRFVTHMDLSEADISQTEAVLSGM